MTASTNSSYRTQNTALAAWLHSQGTFLNTIELDHNGATFVFKQPCSGLIERYTESEAFKFFYSYKLLLDMYHEKRREVRDGKAKTG